ncbi:MAG: haloacid dehalogenase type II [SAR202 cluster bacterium]|jgi:2-haloacid dehalogenase|nr:haloacid dehalogenase type II [SAR202 cluster bacterium]MDP6300643.1 haloacid dehalogenase type II [SAR202 cluster bacterium]MDP7102343.1 haloacid dehalogenase type II [SAR202 cluster bacterium]MDP7225462.1 haloacid dehalogenase type II [SAR202 cluster bacterium]MDP7414135.1 haloacid dehalogenase type II [SAR202 cluster bacterium]|tara:strand:+ start:253 stop:957 length:705 start_codon:yes stop_codon:yes gene_type:complete
MLDFDRYEAVTFDCYGTLIDWETGIVGAVKPVLANHGFARNDAEVLRLYSEAEPAAQQGEYAEYREILRRVMRGIADSVGFTATETDLSRLADSLGDWPVFDDTVGALTALKTRYKLAVVSNIDDDLFELTAQRLGVEFDEVVTAQQARGYKPSTRNFKLLLERLGVDRSKILHVAESLYHDVVPANELGLSVVWVNRHGESGGGATRPADGKPDLEVSDLAALVSQMGCRDQS